MAKWSARDIHDIAGHHLPGVDLVVMVVNAQERARLERLLSRSTGMVGYLRWDRQIGWFVLMADMDGWIGWFVLVVVKIGWF